jgi:hypothetical protein
LVKLKAEFKAIMSKDPRYSVENMLADGDIHLKKGRVLLWTTSGVPLTYDNHFKLSMLSHGCPMFYVIAMPLAAIDTPFGEGKVGVSGIKMRGPGDDKRVGSEATLPEQNIRQGGAFNGYMRRFQDYRREFGDACQVHAVLLWWNVPGAIQFEQAVKDELNKALPAHSSLLGDAEFIRGSNGHEWFSLKDMDTVLRTVQRVRASVGEERYVHSPAALRTDTKVVAFVRRQAEKAADKEDAQS